MQAVTLFLLRLAVGDETKSSHSVRSSEVFATQRDKCLSFRFFLLFVVYALGGLVVSVLATEPTGHSVAGSNPTEGGVFLWVIKIPGTHFLGRGSKAVGPMP
jgi:hypothetical protein